MRTTLIRTFFLFAILFAASHVASAQTDQRAAWQVARYDINATVVGAGLSDRALTARVTVNAVNVGGAAGRQLTARINPAAVVSSVSAGGADAKFTADVDGQTKLLMVRVALPATVQPGGSISVTFDYRLPVADNSGLASVSPEGSQFLPLSYWYPTPNTPIAPRGADYAPYRLTVTAPSGDTIVSAGRASGAGVFDEPLSAQPFFMTGKWDAVEGTGDAKGISALLFVGASADERKRAEELIALTAASRAFFVGLLGPAPDVPLRLVSVRRGAGLDQAGTILVDPAVFRRAKTDNVTAMALAEAVARLWVGGAKAVQGEGAGVVREGLVRFLATLFIEQRFGREAADSERARMALTYAPAAKRDAPLSKSSPAFDTYFNSVANKGALAWRLVMERGVGREQFLAALRREFDAGRAGVVSLGSLRAALGERGGESLRVFFEGIFDAQTDTDLLVGKARLEGGEWLATVRNLGSTPVEVNVAAMNERGERLSARVSVAGKSDAIARFKSASPITLVEVDPEKLYPQIDYSRDIAPWAASSPEEMLVEARTQITAQPARAETLARDLITRAPHLQEARIVLGRALLEQKRTADAERVFRAALELSLPTPATLAWANIGLGEIALRGGQAAEAARRFDEAVRADAEYGSTLAARAARIRAESAAGAKPALDESVVAAVKLLDAAIRSGKKAELDAVILPGELSTFSKGIVGSQPELWQTRVVRTEPQGSGRVAADVEINSRILGEDKAGTAVLVFTRAASGLKLADIQFFEVR